MLDCISDLYVLSDLSKDELESIQHLFKTRNFKKNQIIMFENDISNYVYFLRSGSAKIFRMYLDKEIIVGIAREGHMLGETEIFSTEKNNISSVETLEDSSTCSISKEDFFELIQQYPSILFKAYEILADRVRILNRTVRYLSFYNVRTKVANILLDFCCNFSAQKGNQYIVDNKINQTLIASMVGLTRESVSKTLSDFKKEKIIKLTSNNLIILDYEKLEAISEQDADEASLRKWSN